ncbi:hypothetical protein RRF57_009362 [Xylaria bambusicola]|uniref:Uncharacterized protein n=1 Tax=Xylaria bambusicola TaxID=326684 RepID=A0AAN7UUV2_9PEZI
MPVNAKDDTRFPQAQRLWVALQVLRACWLLSPTNSTASRPHLGSMDLKFGSSNLQPISTRR